MKINSKLPRLLKCPDKKTLDDKIKRKSTQNCRGEYFEKYANMHSVIVCWISLAGVELVWKAWVFREKLRKTPQKLGFSFQSEPNLMSFAFN